jgi:phosphate transport system permease protein
MFNNRKAIEFLRKSWMQTTLGVVLILPFLIGITLLYKSIPLLGFSQIGEVIFSEVWSPIHKQFGLLSFAVSSILVTFVGLIICIPICLGASIYITQFAPTKLSKLLRTVIDILSGMPSVIFGLWGVITVVPMVAGIAKSYGASNQSGYSVLAAGIVVSVSVMPYVLNMLIELFESVSIHLKETALSLGASHWQAVKDVILKKIKPGITATFALGASKAFGETIAVLMVVGNIVQTPKSIFDAGYPLPALIANNYGEMMSIPMYDSALMLSALMLLVIVIVFNFFAHKVIKHYKDQL